MLPNWTKATTSTTGTGTITLTAVTGYPLPSKSRVTGEYVQYSIHTSDGKFEAGIGKIAASDTLERTEVFNTYDGTTFNQLTASALSLVSGTHEVFTTPIAGGVIEPIVFPVTHSTPANPVYVSKHHGAGTTGVALSQVGRVNFQPFDLGASGLLTGFQVKVTTAVTSATLLIGLYEVGSDGMPGRLIAQTGSTINAATTGVKTQSASANVRINAGSYFIAALQVAGASVISLEGATSISWPSLGGFHSTDPKPYAICRDDTTGRTTLQDPFVTSSLVVNTGTGQVMNIGLIIS
jgi:hypothetical protein